MSYVRMVFHVDILAYNSVLKEIKDKADTIMLLIDNIGELDALISVASFRRTLTLWCIPEFVPWTEESDTAVQLKNRRSLPSADQKSGGKQYHCNGRHPGYRFQRFRQIHISEKCGDQQHSCADYPHLHSNLMSGTISEGNDFHGSEDDISSGESYFIVEIRSLKRILDESRKKNRCSV